MHSTHTPWSYTAVSLPKPLMALKEFLCRDQDPTGSFPAVVPGTDLPLPSLEVLPQCSWHSAAFRLNHLKGSSFLISQCLPVTVFLSERTRVTERIPCQRLSLSSWCVSFCCHIQSSINTVPGSLPWDCSCGASRHFCCSREDKLGWHHSSMWTRSAFKCLWNDLPTSAFQCYCCFQELKRHSPSGSAQQEQSSPRAVGIPQSPLCWFEMSQRKVRDALLLSASLGNASTDSGAHWRSHSGGFGLLCSHRRSFSHFCNPCGSKLQGRLQCNVGSFLLPLIWQEIHSQKLAQDIHKVLLKLLKIHLNFLYNSWSGFTIN